MITPSLANGDPSAHPVARASTTSTPPVRKPSPFFLTGTLKLLNKRLLGFVSVLLLVFLTPASASSALAAGDANQTSCPHETEASPGFRTYLPDCRAYEMVSPPFKGGWRVFAEQFSLDGSSFIGPSFGAFAGGTSNEGTGNQYQFIRGSSGWVTTPLTPPASQFGELNNAEFSNGPDIGSGGAALFVAHSSTQSVFEGDLYLREPDGSFALVGPMLPSSAIPPTPTGTGTDSEGEHLQGASIDLSHILFSIEAGQQPAGITTNLWPGDTTTAGRSLYEYLGTAHTGTGGDVPALVGLDNSGSQISGCGTGVAVNPTTFGPGVSSAGATVLFTVEAGGCAGGGTGPAVGQLYARIGDPGSTRATVNLAGTSGCAASTACNVTTAPVYQGASTDGAKVFFTTTQKLSPSDQDTTPHIYECDLPGDSGSTLTPTALVNPCPSLKPVSVTGTAAGARVLGVRAISNDGSHVYFVAEGVLASNENGNKETAVEGANNFYVYERDAGFPSGHTAFIGRLSSSSPSAQATPEGRFLVFTDATDLTPDDKSTAQQVFEYDAESGSLVRVSIGDQGFNNDGNTNIDAAISPGSEGQNIGLSSHPAVSSDGSKVVFASSDGLTPQALNDAVLPGTAGFATNVYEYSGGRVYLISDGRAVNANQDTELRGIDGSGRDIFFGIVDQLVPQDSDQFFDIYDAREGGGFPAPARPVECIVGDSCQGALSVAPQLSLAGSSTQAGGGNLIAPVEVKSKPRRLTSAQKLRRALKACGRRPKRRRAACIRQARGRARHESAKKAQAKKRSS
jgi:hypothetical protein